MNFLEAVLQSNNIKEHNHYPVRRMSWGDNWGCHKYVTLTIDYDEDDDAQQIEGEFRLTIEDLAATDWEVII